MNHREVVVRDVPYGLWTVGAGFSVFGLYAFFTAFGPIWLGGLFFLIGAALLLFLPAVSVVVDRGGGVLRIEKFSLTGRRSQEIRINQIESVYVDHSFNTSGRDSSNTYRVVVEQDDGQIFPLRTAYSRERQKKLQQADAIRRAVGVGGLDEHPMDVRSALTQAFTLNQVEGQEEQTGIPVGEQETNGVRWQLETFQYGGASSGSPVYRWSSTDFDTPDYFIYIAQRMEGAGRQKGLMSLAGSMLIKQSMKLYGFDDYYMPGIKDASPVEGIDRRLDEAFIVYSSNPAEAQRLLNPWTVMPMVGWADRYAMEKGAKDVCQLAVLYSPLGVYVTALNRLNAAQVDELVALGVELIRAQGG